MASFFTAFEDLFKSFYELIAAIVSTIAHVFQSLFAAIIGFFTSIVSLIGDVLGGVVDVAGGVGKFVAGKLSSASRRTVSSGADTGQGISLFWVSSPLGLLSSSVFNRGGPSSRPRKPTDRYEPRLPEQDAGHGASVEGARRDRETWARTVNTVQEATATRCIG